MLICIAHDKQITYHILSLIVADTGVDVSIRQTICCGHRRRRCRRSIYWIISNGITCLCQRHGGWCWAGFHCDERVQFVRCQYGCCCLTGRIQIIGTRTCYRLIRCFVCCCRCCYGCCCDQIWVTRSFSLWRWMQRRRCRIRWYKLSHHSICFTFFFFKRIVHEERFFRTLWVFCKCRANKNHFTNQASNCRLLSRRIPLDWI